MMRNRYYALALAVMIVVVGRLLLALFRYVMG